MVLLGDLVHESLYSVPIFGDGSQLFQAAILIPGGLGLVAWDREHYLSLQGPEGPGYHDARPRFTSFDDLGPALKGLLLNQVEPLLDRLLPLMRRD
jgi:hypothetical protein